MEVCLNPIDFTMNESCLSFFERQNGAISMPKQIQLAVTQKKKIISYNIWAGSKEQCNCFSMPRGTKIEVLRME